MYDLFCTLFCNRRRPFWGRNVSPSKAVYHVSYAQLRTNKYLYIDVVMNLYSNNAVLLHTCLISTCHRLHSLSGPATHTPIHILHFFCILFLNNHLSSPMSPLAPPPYPVVFIRQATVCFVPATDEDNHMVVEMLGIIIQVLVSEVH